ncbi:hypothetical protein JI739_13800 [Ramlibacter sp. AW1]|uniref:General stress protein n=1 Tax=Ramlibacter aurantiacus TaxID=2801330 RepID=A0A937D2B3_9BURK|nr:KGG domain-containing protein [Ramlibacter aurantiacus]MBL0421429.1 hypothetical protein [Ramlibacter aurantiacus]
MATNSEGKQGGSRRGFASMDPERQRAIASKGGKAAHESGNAHQFTSEEARRAGSKGGKAAHEKGTAHEFTSEEARIAGRKGGEASGARGARGTRSQDQAEGGGSVPQGGGGDESR